MQELHKIRSAQRRKPYRRSGISSQDNLHLGPLVGTDFHQFITLTIAVLLGVSQELVTAAVPVQIPVVSTFKPLLLRNHSPSVENEFLRSIKNGSLLIRKAAKPNMPLKVVAGRLAQHDSGHTCCGQ